MRKLFSFCSKFFLCFILFLILAIFSKGNERYKYFIKKNLYQDMIDYSMITKFYNQYLGGIFPLKSVASLQQRQRYVFNEKITYQEISSYLDGAKLTVSSNYLIPINFSGIIVYIGEKEGYGKVVIVKNEKGIDVWYGNICSLMNKLYDHVESGDYLGEVCGNTLYLVYSKGNTFLDYHHYLS